jgi:hypothetical protein
MRPGREIDARVAQEIFGYEVFAKNKVLHENTEKGPRPLRNYSKEIEWAWKVAEQMRVSLIPIEGGQWFAFAGPIQGWENPEAFLTYLRNGDFSKCGASVNSDAAAAICEAALVANQKNKKMDEEQAQPETQPEAPAEKSPLH